jgi:polyhydroxyalkanoate synthase
MPPLTLVHSQTAEKATKAESVPPAPPVQEQTPATSFQIIDRIAHASIARFTAGLSPAGLLSAFHDWAVTLTLAPGKQLDLVRQAMEGAISNVSFAAQCALSPKCDPCQRALPQDKRFRAPQWRSVPFNICAHNFLSIERWWEAAVTDVDGLSKRREAVLTFTARQLLDTIAPSNFILTNPEVLERTRDQLGANLLRGLSNLGTDIARELAGAPPLGLENFKVGQDVAVTPGKVVYRTHLAEIIQYAPTTDRVRPEPVVIVPAWIMKYYILDLSPHNSLVKFLTNQGFTVFLVSWKNPGAEERDTDFDEYRTAGVFINENQIRFLEDMMWERGYLDAKQMAGTFQMLKSNDLIWSRSIHEYLMGEQPQSFDIMAWSKDSTRMPYRMHSQYLRSLFLNNDLAEGRFKVGGRPVALIDIRQPLFVLGTERDHIAPWHSVFKFHLLTDTEITFVLASGGHNGGILSEPGHPHRSFRMSRQRQGEHSIDPENWLAKHHLRDGSWWPVWTAWLAQRSGDLVSPPPLGKAGAGFAPLEDAPGSYVLVR